jgi:EmrB/QacA subfamily drug resistance transporter
MSEALAAAVPAAEARRRMLVLVTMTGALSMIMLDQTVVSVALPTMQRDLSLSPTALQWVVNAYLLSLAALVALGGRLGDIFGQVRFFKAGALLFILASAACGLAQSEWQILGARMIQGAGAAAMVPATSAIIIATFPVSERGKANGIYAGVSMIFLALGPLVGGLLTQYVTWRAVFWVNLPVGAAMLLAAHTTLRKDFRRGGRIDFLGVGLLVPGLVGLVLGLMQGHEWGWGSPATIISLAGGMALLVAFCVIEPRVKDALIELRVFESRNFSVNALVLGLIQFGLTGLTVFGAVWSQDVLGFSPTTAGVALLPLTIPLLIIAPLAGRIYDRRGPRLLVAGGAALVGLAFLWSAVNLHHVDYAWLWPGYLILGAGIGLAITPASTDSLNAAQPALRGQASGVIQTVRQVGGTIGLAVMGTIVATVSANHANSPDPLTPAVSAAYYVASGALLFGAIVAGLLLRRVAASDAEDQVPVTA